MLGNAPQYNLDLLKNIHGESVLTEALANKKGVIVVIPHFGCWELLNAWLNVYTQPMIMYKPYKIKGINRYILAARQKFNATLFLLMKQVSADLQTLKTRWADGDFTGSSAKT
jgi:KDO2-lipid IV(A) lauroyltransferase